MPASHDTANVRCRLQECGNLSVPQVSPPGLPRYAEGAIALDLCGAESTDGFSIFGIASAVPRVRTRRRPGLPHPINPALEARRLLARFYSGQIQIASGLIFHMHVYTRRIIN